MKALVDKGEREAAAVRCITEMRIAALEDALETCNAGWVEKLQTLRKGKSKAEAMQEKLAGELRDATQRILSLIHI